LISISRKIIYLAITAQLTAFAIGDEVFTVFQFFNGLTNKLLLWGLAEHSMEMH
jgi:hypothetical protein